MASQHLLNTLATAFNSMISLALDIGLLIIALTVVKSRRPDVVLPLVAAAVIQAVTTVLSNILYSFVIPGAVSPENMSNAFAITSIFLTLVHSVAWAAILYGIVKLASPQGGAPRDPTRYG